MHHVVCIGDSITQGVGHRGSDVTHPWIDQLARAFDRATGPRPGDGFRALWRPEFERIGEWTTPPAAAAFDVAPFGYGYYSSGRADDRLLWHKPDDVRTVAFDIYWFGMRGAGRWQYRVDDGDWLAGPPPAPPEARLHKLRVPRAVRRCVEIRGSDGSQPVVAPIAGLVTDAVDPRPATGTVVHNLGCAFQMLARFCRPSRGDPFALLDDLRPDLVTVEFSNDAVLGNPKSFATRLDALIDRVRGYASILLVAPFEQRRPRAAPEMQAQYRAVTREVAAAHGCAILDLYDEWAAAYGPGWAAAYAAGLMHDGLHPAQRGHDDIAARMERVLGLPTPAPPTGG